MHPSPETKPHHVNRSILPNVIALPAAIMTGPIGGIPSRLKIIVCGGGIAGFATALLLREEHDVVVLEGSELNLELGAAITLSMNATRLLRSSLRRAGFDEHKARFVEAETVGDFFPSHGRKAAERLADLR